MAIERSLPAPTLVLGYAYPLLFAVGLALAARGETVFGPLYSIDTYSLGFGITTEPGTFSSLLSQGRYGTVVLLWLRGLLGAQGAGVAVSSLLLSVLLFAVAGLLFAKAIFRRPTAAEVTLFLALFTLHPFSTELYHFTDATFIIALATWLAAAGLYAAVSTTRGLLGVAGGVVLLVIALSMYQTAIALLLPVGLLALAARLGYLEEPEPGSLLRSPQARGLFAIVASVPLYLLSVRVVALVSGVPSDARTGFAGFADPLQLVSDVAAFVRTALWPWPGLVTPAASLLLLGLLAISSLAVFWASYRQRGLAISLVCAALLLAALAWSAGATALGSDWLVPRMVFGISISSAGIVMLSWRAARPPSIIWPRLARGLIGAGVIMLVISYVGSSNRILSDQRRLNLWDMQKANRIVMRLEHEPEFRDQLPLAVVGGYWAYPSMLATAVGDMNVSALAVSWSKVGLFSQATGYQFIAPTELELSAAEEYCKTVEPWPDLRSTRIVSGTAVVCLPS